MKQNPYYGVSLNSIEDHIRRIVREELVAIRKEEQRQILDTVNENKFSGNITITTLGCLNT